MFWLKQKENLQAVWSIWSCNAHVPYTPKHSLWLPVCVWVCVSVVLQWHSVELWWITKTTGWIQPLPWLPCARVHTSVCLCISDLLATPEKWALLCVTYVTTSKLHCDQTFLRCVYRRSWRFVVLYHSFVCHHYRALDYLTGVAAITPSANTPKTMSPTF